MPMPKIWAAFERLDAADLNAAFAHLDGFRGAILRHSASQNHTAGSGAWQALTFDTEDRDALGMHAPGTPTRLTIPANYGGVWALLGSVVFTASAGGSSRRVGIAVNGAAPANRDTINELDSPNGSFTNFNCIVGVLTVKVLAAGDFVTLEANQNAAGSLAMPECWFAAVWLGA